MPSLDLFKFSMQASNLSFRLLSVNWWGIHLDANFLRPRELCMILPNVNRLIDVSSSKISKLAWRFSSIMARTNSIFAFECTVIGRPERGSSSKPSLPSLYKATHLETVLYFGAWSPWTCSSSFEISVAEMPSKARVLIYALYSRFFPFLKIFEIGLLLKLH